MRRPFVQSRGVPPLAAAAAVAAAVWLAPAGPALAGPADEAAAAAYDVSQTHCGEAAGASTEKAAGYYAQVTQVWQQTIAAYEATGASYLLYWRGVLEQCLNQTERAAQDLALFVALEGDRSDYAAQVKDAKNRLRRMGVKAPEPAADVAAAARSRADAARATGSPEEGSKATKAAASVRRASRFQFAVGGGYQRTFSWNQLGFAADLSVGVAGPLRIEVGVRPVLAVLSDDGDGDDETTTVYVMTSIGIGPALQFEAPVRPRVGVYFQVAPNPTRAGPGEDAAPAALIGAAGQFGVDIPFGEAPLAFRPFVEGGILGPMPFIRGMGVLVVSL
jgi:hypothetical protein